MSMEENQTVNLLDSETEEEVTLVESLNSEEDNVDITGLTGNALVSNNKTQYLKTFGPEKCFQNRPDRWS